MNQPESRLNPHLEAAFQRVRAAAEQAAERCAEGLGLAALSAGFAKRRDALLAAQYLFRENLPKFIQEFQASLRRQMAGEQRDKAAPAAKKAWGELSLMDDEQVDAMVAADRIGMAIGHQSEWELRDVESFLAGLSSSEGGLDRNPLRPELIAQALLDGVHSLTEEQDIRQALIDELTRAFTTEMRACYADIATLFRNRGLRQQDLRVRAMNPSGGMGGMGGPNSVAGDLGGPIGNSRFGGLGPAAQSGFGGMGGYAAPGYGAPMQSGGFAGGINAPSGFSGGGYATGYGGGYAPAGVMGSVDPQLMELLRRLSSLPMPAGGGMTGTLTGGMGGSGFGASTVPGTLPGSGSASMPLGGGDWGDDTIPGGALSLPPNLIHLHRDALRQAATGSLDHMVIDVVGSLFDHILSDAKVPPQMARLLAQLQLPVLRAALGDNTFFSSRRHPVRRFINRLASLACAYDDFADSPGKEFLEHVRALVHDVSGGDFERIEIYEQKLDDLEAFVSAQTAQVLQAHGDAAALVERKETDLRLQQRYAKQLAQNLAKVPMPDFLREFLSQTWSGAIVQASRHEGGSVDREKRFRQFGRDLVLSVQPKAPGPQRQAFLSALPRMMQTLNEGLDLIAWPEALRKPFIGQLLPVHAESLKGQGLSALDYNLLVKQLEAVFGIEAPKEQDLPPVQPDEFRDTESGEVDIDLAQGLNAKEASSLGLVQEASVDWKGEVDIDITAQEAPLQAVDISIDGLPSATEEPEPSSGVLLIDHLQLGFAYQMNTGEHWRKVRLAHISAGRSFFIFTQGHKHQQTVTMTARMLRKLCETGRLRAFENAYLLERATARARKQLAALNTQQ
ncbi:DUF1631 family protein [Mitsuaria sp. WAJ17]|uniref:DUF1631 family protein n=1 Tax=Mitsuaria sp. WAJ17 TaxID=2761452 RepID=UPI0015FFFDFD|nr:DUF1631 family protein [Mitsuaria sp. WAJ17]MBB2484643.1 DUF1631 family protein [Mitsuaria sp. WAJ17]